MKDEVLKNVIVEKDKLKLRYKQRLNDIKEHYKVEFDVEHNDVEIKNIVFINLKYKDSFNNLSVTYDNTTKVMDYINYEYTDSRMVKTINHKRIIPLLVKEYKLNFVIAEIERAHKEYLKELEHINKNV